MLLNTNTITINDNPITLNEKLARIEANAIIQDFEKDFNFDLLALPNLDLPLKEYCRELVNQAYNDEMESSSECLQCLHNSVNHHCPCQY